MTMPTTLDPSDRSPDRDLAAVLVSVVKEFGAGVVITPEPTAAGIIPTSCSALNQALRIGGIPRGRITEIYGPEDACKTTLALDVVAAAQQAGGGTCLYIDTEHALDTSWAATVGVDTDELLLCQPESGEQALNVARVLIDSGKVQVVVVDSIAGLVPEVELTGQIGDHHAGAQALLLSQALRQLTDPIARHQVAFVATNQLRQRAGRSRQVLYTAAGRSLPYYASLRLSMDKATEIRNGGEVVGRQVRVRVVKNKLAQAGATCQLEVRGDEGVSADTDHRQLAAVARSA